MKKVSTSEMAASIGLKPQTLRAAVSKSGSYYGIKPDHLPNGRLLWPANAAERLTKKRKDDLMSKNEEGIPV